MKLSSRMISTKYLFGFFFFPKVLPPVFLNWLCHAFFFLLFSSKSSTLMSYISIISCFLMVAGVGLSEGGIFVAFIIIIIFF